MKTSALFQNTIFSFFLKRASTVKYCAFFAAYVLCAIGAWGTNYTWTGGGGTDLNWTNVGNWTSDSVSSYPRTGDTAIFEGDEPVTVVLDADIEISKLQTGTGGRYTVTINTNGHTLTSSSFIVNAEYGGTFGTNTVITGGGSVKTETFDFPNKNNHNVTIDSGTTLEISTTLYGNADNGTLTFKGSGTLNLPASGANVDYGESKITYDRSTGLKVLPLGEPTYYNVTATELDDFPTTNITITITRNETDDSSLEQVKYPYTFTTTNTGGGTFSFNGQNGDSNGSLPIEPTATDKKAEFTLKYSEPENLAPGDGFTLTIRTPDNSMELAVISYYKDKPRWTGAENSSWENVANWTGITNISEITSTSEITINSGVSNYPEISANVSLKSLTITSNAKVTMTGGSLTVDKLICTGNSNFTATGGTVVFGNSETDAEFSADYPDNSSFCNVEVTVGKNFTSSNSMTITGDFTSNGNTTLSSGTLSVSGTATVSSGAEINVNNADFSGTVTNNGEISCGGGEVTFGSTLTNNGTITGGSGAVTFGETVNSGEITCSTTSTIFNGAVTVEASGTITGTDGAVSFDGIVTNGGTITGGAGEVSFGSTLTNDGTITGGSGELLFLESVTNDGTITAGNSGNDTAAVTFSQEYAGTGGTLVGSDTDSTYIDFYGNTEFGNVTVNKSSLRFMGSTAQTFTPNGQSVNAVIFANTGGTTLNGSLTADGLITVSGILSCGSPSAITSNAGLTIENSGTLNAGNSEITLSNGTEWNNGGMFNCGTGTVIVSDSATILGENTFYNFKCTTAGATVTFEAGKTQTVSGNFTVTGSTDKILLTSDNTWTIDVSPAKTKVKNAIIQNSKSLQVLAGLTGTDVDYTTWTDNGGNINWFSASYIWKGSENTDWDTAENWTDTNGQPVAVAPQTNNNEVDITIGKVDEPAKNTLEVNSDLSLKSITVNSGSTIDLASHSVKTKDTDIGFTNNGTVRLEGTGTQSITGTMINGSGSTVEYYGTVGTSLPWDGDSSTGKNYENIAFTTGASASDITDTVTVFGTTTIDTGSSDVKLSSTGNSFSGKITVTTRGAVSITAADTVKIAAGAECNSLEINGNTALYGNVTTTDAQAYNGNVTLYANSSLIANSGGAAQTVTLGKDSDSQIKTDGTMHNLSVGKEGIFSNCTVKGKFDAQLGSFTVYGKTTVDGGAVTAGTQSYNGAVTVLAGGTITGTDGTVEFKSTVTNNGTIICGGGDVTFRGNVTNDGKITASDGAVTFNGNVTNDGEISGSTGTITFSGTYGSSTATETTPAILKASSGYTYFSSAANFSYTTFTANSGTVLFNSATGQTLTTNGQTFNNVTLPDTGTTSLLTVNGTLNINGTLTTGTNRTLDMQTNNSALNAGGTTANSGEIKLGSQPAQFTGTVTNSGKITASHGAVTFGETTNSGTITGGSRAVTFGGNVTNDGEISGSFGELTFSGTYRSSTATEATPAILKESSGNTYFSSDADFSYTMFTANSGTVVFNSSADAGQTLKLANATTFNKISIQTSAGRFTAEGTENGKLIANTLTLINTNADAIFNVPINATTIEMKNTAETAGAVTFNNDVTAVTIDNTTTDSSVINFDITFNAATTVTNSVTFGTTGMLTLGNDTTDTLTFAGGMTHTQGNTTLCGKIITDSAPVVLSSDADIKTLTLTGNSTIQTTGAEGNETGASITLGAVSASVSDEEKTLSLTGGTGNITVYDTVGSESTKLGNITIKGNAVTLQKQVTTKGELSVTHSGSFTIAEAANITADGGFTQAGTGTLAIGGTSITTKNAPISFNGSGTLTLNGDILLISSSAPANGGNITINTPIEAAGDLVQSLTLSAGKGNIYFNSDTGTTKTIKAVSIQSASEVEFTNKLNANKISVTAKKITLTQNAQLDNAQLGTEDTELFSYSGILLLKPGCSIEASTIEQNGSGKNQIAGKITAQKIILKNDTYIYNETEINAGTFTVCNFIVGNDSSPADLYISALEGGSPAQVTFNAETHIFGNYALFNGNVTQNENLSVEKDIILLNGNTAAMYKDANDGSSSSGVADLFKYTGRNSSVIAKNSLSLFPDTMPDGTPINHSGKYTSTFNIHPGITISAKQNFYDNGTALTPGGSWTLKLKPNDRAKDAFAELYNAKIAYCTVTATTSRTVFLSAAENCTDVGNNDGVFFSRPEILVHNAANPKDTDGNANLSGTYTVYDNVIRVEFVDSLTKQPLKIENSCNEISAALSTIEFGGTSQKIFEGAYTTAECTQSTDRQGDLSVFFLKTADSDKWNTDATGISKGADESTDWNGTHRTAIPYLNIPKALDSVWQTLRDEHKNRISHYYTETPQLSSENGTSGATFTATADLCAPVLVAVRTGQELHAKNDGTAESQLPYDSHNFIELQYSEPVNTGNILLTSTGDENIQNIQVADNFGKIEGNSGNGITISGLIKTAAGMLKTGSNGTEDNLVHSLYRKFSVTAGAEASFNTNRLRISIAGYVDKTVSTARGSFKHWKGYIDSAETPSGTVTRLYTSLITDKYGNTIEPTGTDAHKLPGLSVISEQSELYGKWDTHAPVFAAYKNITNDEDSGFEAIGTSNVDGTTLDRIEFHVFDNETNEPDWYIRTGWCNSSKSLFTPFSYAADIFGGARPFSTDKKVRTSGGLRYASLYDKSSSFSYKIDSGNPTAFSTDEITGGAKGLVFRTQSDVTNATGGEDGLYFSVYLADFSIPLKTTFEVTYNENGFVTDLAGNRMKTETITTIDRTPPAFNMSIGAVPDDSGNSYEELYVIFNKKLNTNSVIVYNNDGTTETKQFSEALRESLRFIDSSTKSPAQDISISTEKEVTVVFQNEYFTGLKIPLNRSLTYGNIKNLWIQAFTEKTSVDPLSGVENANVTYIQDTLGNYLPHKSAHAISDFAVNVVNPIYAYDTQTTEDGAFFSQQMYQDGSWAVHDWNAEQKNYGTLSAGYDLFIEANLSDGSGEAPEDTTVFAYFDTMPDTQALSVTYNENISGTALSSWRIWLPNYITDSSGTQERSPVFKALSPQNNTMSKQTVLSGIKGEVPADAKTTGEIQFSLNTTTMENAGWKSGDQISFLFALSDGSNNPVKICHAPEYDSLTDTYTTEESPLFALRLKNSGDLTSADLWSFKLQSITKQRGGVTILNNVINASKGEKTVVQVNMPSGGTLNVIVMTLDGNIVKYLQHGEASQGEHNYTWDGTTKSGKKVARGLYFIRVFGNGIDETRKVMVVK